MIAATRHSILLNSASRLLLNQASALSCTASKGSISCQQFQRSFISSTTTLSDRIVVAVGGNALQRRGERLTIENMLKAAAEMAPTIVNLTKEHELVLTHGNGPQVGELALERSAAR
jgi:hypothetical protein